MNSSDIKKEDKADQNFRSEKITRPDLTRNIAATHETAPETTRYSSGGQIDVIIATEVRSGIQKVLKRQTTTAAAPISTPAPVSAETSTILPSAKKVLDRRAYRRTLPSITALISQKQKNKELVPPHIQTLAVRLRALQKKGFKSLTDGEREEFSRIADQIREYLEKKSDKKE